MSFSLSNFLFGLLPSVGFIFLIFIISLIFKFPKKKVLLLIPIVLLINIYYSFQTYAPVNKLNKTELPDSPEFSHVEKTPDFIEYEDKRGNFDKRIKNEKVE